MTQDVTIKQYVDKLMEKMDQRLDSIETKLDQFIKCADDKYASKTVEKIVYAYLGAFILVCVGAVAWFIKLLINYFLTK